MNKIRYRCCNCEIAKKAIDATGAEIVLSLSWRRIRKCEDLEEY
jgi:hypothetical protein